MSSDMYWECDINDCGYAATRGNLDDWMHISVSNPPGGGLAKAYDVCPDHATELFNQYYLHPPKEAL